MARSYNHKISKNKRADIRRSNHKSAKNLENKVKSSYENKGWNVKRVAHNGYDFKATKNGHTRFVEVKSNNSALKPSQKRAQSRLGSRYHVERFDT